MRAQRANDRNELLGWVQMAFAAAALVLIVVAAGMAWGDVPRTSDGKPDLSGYYDTATATPLQRRADEATLSAERAEFLANQATTRLYEGSGQLDAEREAPPEGGDGSAGAAGNVGGYQGFWVDPGERHTKVDGEYRTSIIVDPANGRLPERKGEARARMAKRYRGYSRRQNDGTAWWGDEPGPYDDPEVRPMPDRCLVGFSSTAGPPMLPALYNNHNRIVQTPGHVMILTEMVHDARIVRIGSEHAPDDIRRWIGDSIGWWEGDTLVVETTNFNDTPALGQGASRALVCSSSTFRVLACVKLLSRLAFVCPSSAIWVFACSKPLSKVALFRSSSTFRVFVADKLLSKVAFLCSRSAFCVFASDKSLVKLAFVRASSSNSPEIRALRVVACDKSRVRSFFFENNHAPTPTQIMTPMRSTIVTGSIFSLLTSA